MKKQILSLMLSASILSVSPLFAMESPEDAPHKTAIKRTAPIEDGGKTKATKAFQRYQRAYDNYSRSCMRRRHLSGGTAFEFVISPYCEHLHRLMDLAYQNKQKYSE